LESNKLIPSQVHECCLIQTGQKPLCDDKNIERYGCSQQTEKQVKYRQWANTQTANLHIWITLT